MGFLVIQGSSGEMPQREAKSEILRLQPLACLVCMMCSMKNSVPWCSKVGALCYCHHAVNVTKLTCRNNVSDYEHGESL
jgi:hypothetical protein